MSGKQSNPTKTSEANSAAPQPDTAAAAVTQLATAATTAINDLVASAQSLILQTADKTVATAVSLVIDELLIAAKDQLQAIAAAATPVQATVELVPFTTGTPEPVATKLTAAEVCQRVKRRTVYEDKGATREVLSTLSPSELLSWHDHGTHLTVVTVDGKKFSSAAVE